jgi:hypothetical protein
MVKEKTTKATVPQLSYIITVSYIDEGNPSTETTIIFACFYNVIFNNSLYLKSDALHLPGVYMV